MQQVLLHPLPETLVTWPQKFEGTVWTFHHKLTSNQTKFSTQQSGMTFPGVIHKPLMHLLDLKPVKKIASQLKKKHAWLQLAATNMHTHIITFHLPRYSAFLRKPPVFENLYDPLQQKSQMSTGHHSQKPAPVPSEFITVIRPSKQSKQMMQENCLLQKKKKKKFYNMDYD